MRWLLLLFLLALGCPPSGRYPITFCGVYAESCDGTRRMLCSPQGRNHVIEDCRGIGPGYTCREDAAGETSCELGTP